VGNETTNEKRKGEHLKPFHFKPGNSGRPKGARNKLGEDFLKALQEDFAKHGVEAIATVREEKPDQYLKVIASILPKEIDVGENLATAMKESRDAAAGAFFRAMAEDMEALN
jgi:hypothetical protein